MMLASEGLNDIDEHPTSEWGEDAYLEDDLDDELDLKTNLDLVQTRNHSSRPDTHLSIGSQLPGESGYVHSKTSPQTTFDLNVNNLKHDPLIESIIESRKSDVIENDYTDLSQITSRSSQNLPLNSFKPHSIIKPKAVQFDSDRNDAKSSTLITTSSKVVPSDNDRWDDKDLDKEVVRSVDKSSVQLYEETCKRLNICPCSVIIRSLFTTKIDLKNYGLRTKGSAALAVALLRNTSVLSLNLSGNNIRSDGMSHIYQIMTENAYVEEYDVSFNNLGTNGIQKLAAGVSLCVLLKTLNVAGNNLRANDINILLSKLENHPNIKDLNLSHNQLDEEGGISVGKWLSDNNVLLNLDVSWCSIRLLGARVLAKAIGDNNKLLKINLSNNSFTNDTIEYLTNSLTRNTMLKELNLYSNEIFCRYDTRIREDPSILIIGKETLIYRLFLAATTNQSLQIFRLGKNHLDGRCIMIILESLSKLENLSLEELDLTGLTLTSKQISEIEKLFVNQSKFTCYVGHIRQTVEQFTNNLLNSIEKYCRENEVSLSEVFSSNEQKYLSISIINAKQFRDGLRKAKIPFPAAQIDNIIKYLADDDDEDGTISLRSLEIV